MPTIATTAHLHYSADGVGFHAVGDECSCQIAPPAGEPFRPAGPEPVPMFDELVGGPFVSDPLTPEEHAAMAMLAEFWNHACAHVLKPGPPAEHDAAEIVFHVHALQRMILAQAAARAYPTKYRLLGRTIGT